MAVPFASAYAPINTLNAAIQAQDQFGQNVGLQRRQMDDQMVMATMNRILQQKALQQQSADRQQHYGLQQQQLQNDLAYRHQALTAAAAEQTERKRQFDRVATMNEMLARSQVDRPQLPSSAITEMGRRDEFNAEAGGITSGINMSLQAAKAKRDAALKEIEETRKSLNPGDLWTDLWTSNSGWAKQARTIEGAYKDEIGAIAQAAQGRAIIRQKGPDEFEAIPVTLPQLNFPGMKSTPRTETPEPELPDAAPFPAAWGRPVAVAPTATPRVNPFAQYGGPAVPPWVGYMNRQTQPANAPVPAAQATKGVHYRENADGTTTVLVPIITPAGKVIPIGTTGTFRN